MQRLDELAGLVDSLSTAPPMEEMPRRTLADKGIAGPTAAHCIEEVHVPFNLAYMTFTTGSTAFQNIVGVTNAEIPDRVKAAHAAFKQAGVPTGTKALITYAPLVNVFPAQALHEYGMEWRFLRRSSRDAAILSLCRDKPGLVVGESSFLRASLADATSLGVADLLPRDILAFCTGTPLDLEFLLVAEKYGWRVHDLYGCQEFGWLALDGIPLRPDISLAPSPCGAGWREMVVGGLPLADSFPVGTSGHVCNPEGKIITYRRERTAPEYEVHIAATVLSNPSSVERAARTILRIKGRVVKVRPDIICNAPATALELVPGVVPAGTVPKTALRLESAEKTLLFDLLLQAQCDFQATGKTDPAWIKRR